MIGAVLGDIIGSKWEFFQVNEYYKEDMELLKACHDNHHEYD